MSPPKQDPEPLYLWGCALRITQEHKFQQICRHHSLGSMDEVIQSSWSEVRDQGHRISQECFEGNFSKSRGNVKGQYHCDLSTIF